ncbi:MAG: NAD(P)-dependent oxidoreductase [Rhodospirillaceae bacterium]
MDEQPSQTNAPGDGVPAMFPLMLDIGELPIFFVTGGDAVHRIEMLDEHGAKHLSVFAKAPSEKMRAACGGRLTVRWPDEEDFKTLRPRIVFVAGMEENLAKAFRTMAKTVGALVHVEDRIPLCDFHLPARVRRGHLQVTVSTDGTVAGLSRLIREHLEAHVFGPEWSERVDELAAARRKWKDEGYSFDALSRAIREFVTERQWLVKK